MDNVYLRCDWSSLISQIFINPYYIVKIKHVQDLCRDVTKYHRSNSSIEGEPIIFSSNYKVKHKKGLISQV